MSITFVGINALVIDNDVDSVRALRAALEPYGLRITTAESVEQARAVVVTLTPDIVISELALEGETGLEFVRWLRSEVRYAKIPVIGMTPPHEKYSREDADAAGVTMFFRKPINPMEIVVAVALLTRW